LKSMTFSNGTGEKRVGNSRVDSTRPFAWRLFRTRYTRAFCVLVCLEISPPLRTPCLA